MKIKKQEGLTRSERLLATLCEKTFLKLWSWPNPRKEDGKELCDVIAVFEDHIFIFFDRESKTIQNKNKEIDVTWPRWKKEVIDKQVRTARGAAKYVRDRHPIFLDAKCEQSFPGTLPEKPIIHKFVVAHGAKEACEAYSEDNVFGSLAIAYGQPSLQNVPTPFFVELERNDPVHVLDSVNLGIILGELDTYQDFVAYVSEKEDAIKRHELLFYCGEEDLLAHYFLNCDSSRQKYRIGVDPRCSALWIGEGEWKGFVSDGHRDRRKAENVDSYLWDRLIQITHQYALEGRTQGASLWSRENALYEMAREPRLKRRLLSRNMQEAIESFPGAGKGIVRKVAYMQSHDPGKMYVFLQMRCQDMSFDECHQIRRAVLELACGVLRNRFGHLKMVVGIGVEAPKYSDRNAEDFVLLKCETWSEEQRAHYEGLNEEIGLFTRVGRREQRVKDFG